MTLQNKLLFPVLTAIVLFMTLCTFILSDILISKNEMQTVDLLRGGDSILIKNIRNIEKLYTSSIRSISHAPIMHAIADFLSVGNTGQQIPREQALMSIQALLEDFPRKYPDFSRLNLIDRDGDIIASSNRHLVGQDSVQEMRWFKECIQGKEVISEPLLHPRTGEKILVVANPVFNAQRKPSAVLCGVIPCTVLIENTIDNVHMSKTGYSYIVDGRSGLMLAHNVYGKVQTMDMFRYQPWMRDLKPDESGVKMNYYDSQGNRRVAIYHKEPVSGWIAVSCVSFDEIAAQAASIRNLIILMMLGCTLLVAIVLVVVVRSVTEDVHRTNRYAQAVTAGRLDAELEVNRDDELGDLGVALHRMVESLKQMVLLNIKQTEERRRNLSALRDSMLVTLADLVESRDQNTGDHIRKTASYVRIILDELKREGLFTDIINDDYIMRVVSCAPMHDIGKIKVPDAILNKPGKLTDEEFAVMKSHAAAGGEVISQIQRIVPDSEYLTIARDIATHHHEKWDGKGYPDGLAGDQIPLSARVMAVADVFDALVSERVYKKAFPVEKAFSIISEESGTHFDPRIVSAFLAAKEDIVRVEEGFRLHELQYSDPDAIACA